MDSYITDATPTYRGYRRQFLYIIYRILSDSNFQYLPEGHEDLDIYQNNRLIELVQIKDLSNPLTLSSFYSSDLTKSFFSRIKHQISLNPDISIKIISFGNIGEEIEKAISGDGEERRKVRSKLKEKFGFSDEMLEKILHSIKIEPVNSKQIEGEIRELISKHLPGQNISHSFEILNWWIFLCSENKSKISQEILIDKLQNIGKFLVSREDYHKEWFRSIKPLEVPKKITRDLQKEFEQGISVGYEHISNNLDIKRNRYLEKLHKEFNSNKIVIIHGASGQGKSTLAFRYLHDYIPEYLRYQIKYTSNQEQVSRITNALTEYSENINLPLYIYLDVTPQLQKWHELLNELYRIENIKVLVSIREEDYRKTYLSKANFDFSDLELSLNKDEAQKLYTTIQKSKHNPNYITFEDAWKKFGEVGPLLEFMFILNTGETLKDRLTDQINHILDQEMTNEVEILRLISCVSQFDCRLDLVRLADTLDLTEPNRIIQKLEKEYLIRTNKLDSYVTGLHPVRSAIINRILTDFHHRKLKQVKQSLNLIVNEDVEIFLLSYFSDNFEDINDLTNYLLSDEFELKRKNFTYLSGILNALLWAGIRVYIEENNTIIHEIYNILGNGWWLVFDCDIANITNNSYNDLWKNLESKIPSDRVSEIKKHSNRQSAKKKVFNFIQAWLEKLSLDITVNEIEQSNNFNEWQGLADIMFWAHYINVNLKLNLNNSIGFLKHKTKDFPIELLADLHYVFYYQGDEFNKHITDVKQAIVESFRKAFMIIDLKETDDEIKVIFIPNYNTFEDSSSSFLHEQTMKIVNLLRRFYPEKKKFSTKSTFPKLSFIETSHDPTNKAIPVENLHLSKLVDINNCFINLSNYLLFRPDTWKDYSNSLIKLRQFIINKFNTYINFLNNYFRKSNIFFINDTTEKAVADKFTKLINNPPLLPKCTVDKWGFSSEFTPATNNTENEQSMIKSPILSIKQKLTNKTPYIKFSESIRTYLSSIGNFLTQSEHVIVLNESFGKTHNSNTEKVDAINVNSKIKFDINTIFLSMENLSDSYKRLTLVQNHFSIYFRNYYPPAQLEKLNQKESEHIFILWAMWHYFCFKSHFSYKNATKDLPNDIKNKIRKIQQRILKHLKKEFSLKGSFKFIPDYHWNKQLSMLIIADCREAKEFIELPQKILRIVLNEIGEFKNQSIKDFIVKQFFEYLYIIPFLNGKTPNNQAWRIRIPSKYQPKTVTEMAQFEHFPLEIPKDVIKDFEIQTWKNDDHCSLSLTKHISQLYEQTVLLGELANYNVDEFGNNIVIDYANQTNQILVKLFQKTLDSLTELINQINQLEEKQELLNICIEIHQLVLPKQNTTKDENIIEASMDLKQIKNWSDQLLIASNHSYLLYLKMLENFNETKNKD